MSAPAEVVSVEVVSVVVSVVLVVVLAVVPMVVLAVVRRCRLRLRWASSSRLRRFGPDSEAERGSPKAAHEKYGEGNMES